MQLQLVVRWSEGTEVGVTWKVGSNQAYNSMSWHLSTRSKCPWEDNGTAFQIKHVSHSPQETAGNSASWTDWEQRTLWKFAGRVCAWQEQQDLRETDAHQASLQPAVVSAVALTAGHPKGTRWGLHARRILWPGPGKCGLYYHIGPHILGGPALGQWLDHPVPQPAPGNPRGWCLQQT